MSNKKTNDIYNQVANTRSAQAIDNPDLVFYKVVCPYCDYENVISRGFINQKMLCLHSGCRRIIEVGNYQELNDQNSGKKKIA